MSLEAGLARHWHSLAGTQQRLVDEAACDARGERRDTAAGVVELAVTERDHVERVVEDQIELVFCEASHRVRVVGVRRPWRVGEI